MELDYNPANQTFILRVFRGDGDANMIQRDEGFNLSRPASTNAVKILFTREPYAAVGFWEYATKPAKAILDVLHREVEASRALATSFQAKVPAGEQLAPFQNAAVEYALRREHCLDGDAPGLGKSPTAMAIDNEMGAKRTTIICPASIRLQWASVIQRWTTRPWPYYTYPIMTGAHGVHPDTDFTIVSYDLARTNAIGAALSRIRTDHLIIDEAHYAKESTTQRARAIFGGGENRKFDPIIKGVARVTALTGTPLPNRPREAYTLTRGLCFDAIDWMSEDRFRERFNPSMTRTITKKTGEVVHIVDERSGRHGELQSRLRANYMTRHEKRGPNGVGHQLGLMDIPSVNIVHVEPDVAIRTALEVENLLHIDPDDWDAIQVDPESIGSIATARRMMGEAMAPHCLAYILDVLEGGEDKLFVVAYHINVMDYLNKKLSKYNLRRIDGSTNATVKERLKQEFIDDPSVQVLLANMLTGGTGLDGLQAVCSHLVVCEPEWVMGNNVQVIDRLDRGGQTDHVQTDFMVAPGSLSEKILAKAIQKGHNTHKALDRRM